MVLDRESGKKVFNAVDNRIKIYANELFKKSPYNSTCWGRVISNDAGVFTVEINKKIYNNIVALRNVGTINANEVVMIGIPNNQMNNAVILGVADGSMQQSSGSGTVTSVTVSGGTGLSSSGSPITSSGTITINHTNSVVAKTTQAVYPITFDSEGHITSSGTAIVVPTNYVTLDTTQTITGTKTFSADPIISGIKNGSYTLSVPTLSANDTIALVSQIPSLTGYVPYTGATTNLNLGTHSLYTTGKIGAGTTEPLTRIAVVGNGTNETAFTSFTPNEQQKSQTISVEGLGSAWYVARDNTNGTEFACGTSLASGNPAFIGAISAHALELRTSNVARLTIASTGAITTNSNPLTTGVLNVNVTGTTSAGASNISINDGTYNNAFTITNTATTGYSRIKYVGTGITYTTGVGNSSAVITSARNNWYLYDFTNAKMKMLVSNTTTSLLDNNVTIEKDLTVTGAITNTGLQTNYAHSLVLSGTSLYLYNNLGTPTALSTLTISDSSSASAISTNARLVTERDIYYGLPNINGSHSYTSSTSIYAPTSQLSTSTSKRYIIGASSTTSMATENTNASCYMQSGVLYSNNLATLNTGNISTVYNNTDTQVYSSKYVEDNFAQMLYTTPYYANKTATTTADLTSTIPTLSASNYLTSTTTNTTFNWTTPNYTFTNTLTGNLSLQASSLIYLSLPFSISLASQTVNFGYRVKVNGVAISSNQTFGAVAYTGDSGHTIVNRVYLQCTTDSLTEKTNYGAGDIVTIEVFTQQATSTSMTTRAYCGATINQVDYYTFNELVQFKSQLSNATPTIAGIVYGQTSSVDSNTFYGYNAGLNNTTARDNVAIGLNALYSNSVALRNIAIGNNALYNNGLNKLDSAESNDNIAIGYGALEYSKRGYSNIAIGNSALLFNSLDSTNICESNVAIGILSQEFNFSGSYNTSIGAVSLMNNSGSENVAVGMFSGMKSGDNFPLNNSNNSVFIGSQTKALADNQTNEIVIGYNTTGHGSNTATWGNTSIINHYFTGNVNATGDISIPTGKTLKINNVDALATITTALSNKFTNHSQGAYNCNTCYDEGVYLIAMGPNCPSGSPYGSLFVMPYRKPTGNIKPDYCTQIYIPNGDDPTAPNSMFYRTSLANYWNAWQEVATMGGLNTKAKVDASNLTSGNVTSWQDKLGYERVETVYDRTSASSTYNWGYTSGISGNTTITGKDFSKYKYLKIRCRCGPIDLICMLYLTHLNAGSNTYISSIVGITTTGHREGVLYSINSGKTSFSFVQCGYILNNQNNFQSANTDATWKLYNIEGVY